jgi:hypothetical protein
VVRSCLRCGSHSASSSRNHPQFDLASLFDSICIVLATYKHWRSSSISALQHQETIENGNERGDHPSDSNSSAEFPSSSPRRTKMRPNSHKSQQSISATPKTSVCIGCRILTATLLNPVAFLSYALLYVVRIRRDRRPGAGAPDSIRPPRALADFGMRDAGCGMRWTEYRSSKNRRRQRQVGERRRRKEGWSRPNTPSRGWSGC